MKIMYGLAHERDLWNSVGASDRVIHSKVWCLIPRGELRCCFHFPRSNKANSHFLHSVVWRVCVFVYIRHQTELVSFTQSLHYKKKAQSVKLSWMNNDSRVDSFGTVPFWSHWQTTVAMRDYWNIAFCQLSQISVPQQKNKIYRYFATNQLRF